MHAQKDEKGRTFSIFWYLLVGSIVFVDEFRDIFVKPSSAPSSMSAEASAGNGQVRTDKLSDSLLAREIVNFWAPLANKSGNQKF